jgi:hypothetical protein
MQAGVIRPHLYFVQILQVRGWREKTSTAGRSKADNFKKIIQFKPELNARQTSFQDRSKRIFIETQTTKEPLLKGRLN